MDSCQTNNTVKVKGLGEKKQGNVELQGYNKRLARGGSKGGTLGVAAGGGGKKRERNPSA